MSVFVATDIRLTCCDGRLYVVDAVSTIFRRYVDNFGKLVVCCRLVQSDDPEKKEDVTDLIEEVIPVGGLVSAFTGKAKRKIKLKMRDCDLVIGRFHSIFGCLAADCAKSLGKPFFAEVMGDAWDGYWNHGITGKLIAPFIFLKTKQAIKNADYALYVTSEFLQKRYPCKNPSVGVSNVRIESVDPQVLEQRLEKIRNGNAGELSLMTTAAVDVRYKGQEYVIRAIPLLNKAGLRVKYTLVGGGSQDYLRQVAEKCGVADQVVFAGRKSLDEVFALLDETDIYIQPSLQEGLPRSVIEAMSRGCPAIGARTAGIPELIPSECVIRRKSAKNIVKAVLAIWDEKKLMQLAERNFDESKIYLDESLTQRRNAYFHKIKQELGI